MKKYSHRSFALVLSGGGGRALAHAGVLKALEHYGLYPSAIVGVSMGAIVGASYALNPAWYFALANMDTKAFPRPVGPSRRGLLDRVRTLLVYERALLEMFTGWGIGEHALQAGMTLLKDLTRDGTLEKGRIPVAVIATDLYSGQRVIFREGEAARAIYASAALPGVLPPLPMEGQLLADGSYIDDAPVDIARDFGAEVVIAVDTSQNRNPSIITNGIQAMLRATEICHHQHAQMRFEEADLVIRPDYPVAIDILDFSQKRACVVIGILSIRRQIDRLRSMLTPRITA